MPHKPRSEAQMYNGGIPDRFNISDFSSILLEGENVLAIQVTTLVHGHQILQSFIFVGNFFISK